MDDHNTIPVQAHAVHDLTMVCSKPLSQRTKHTFKKLHTLQLPHTRPNNRLLRTAQLRILPRMHRKPMTPPFRQAPNLLKQLLKLLQMIPIHIMTRKREHLGAHPHEAYPVPLVPQSHLAQVLEILPRERLDVSEPHVGLVDRVDAAGASAEHGRLAQAEDGVHAGVAESSVEGCGEDGVDGGDDVDAVFFGRFSAFATRLFGWGLCGIWVYLAVVLLRFRDLFVF